MIPINIACEDVLSEAIALKILDGSNKFSIGTIYRRNGKTYLRQKVTGFNNASKGMPYFFLVDLDKDECAPKVISEWLGGQTKNKNFIFRIAVEEIESWLLADRQNFSSFVGIRKDLIPLDSDLIPNPKEFLVNVIRKSSKREIKTAIVPKTKSTALVGPNYNGKLIEFINTSWSLIEARLNSRSLEKTIKAIDSFSYE